MLDMTHPFHQRLSILELLIGFMMQAGFCSTILFATTVTIVGVLGGFVGHDRFSENGQESEFLSRCAEKIKEKFRDNQSQTLLYYNPIQIKGIPNYRTGEAPV